MKFAHRLAAALAVACLAAAGSAAWAEPAASPPAFQHAVLKASPEYVAAYQTHDVRLVASADRPAFLFDASCDGSKDKGKKDGKKKPPKKCITANVPLDDGYMLAKGKPKGKRKPPST